MTNFVLLMKKIEESGLKRSFIAQKLGITRSALHNKLKGLSEFSLSEVSALCDVLSITSLIEKERIFFAKKVDE